MDCYKTSIIAGLLKLQRQSQVKLVMLNYIEQDFGICIRRLYVKVKLKGDWTAYMLADGDSDWVDELLMLAPQTAENP